MAQDRNRTLADAELHERRLERSLHIDRGLLVEAARMVANAIQVVDNALERKRD